LVLSTSGHIFMLKDDSCMDKRTSENLTYLEISGALLLALILNINGLRLFMGNNVNLFSYALFFLFGLAIAGSHLLQKRGKPILNRRVAVALAITLVWCGVSILVNNGAGFQNFIKFCICIVLAYLAAQLSDEQRLLAVKTSIAISAIYALYTIIDYQLIYNNYVVPNVYNYLDITLPVGLGLSFSMALLLVMKNSKRAVFLYVMTSVLQLFSLLKYSARGNLMFPLLSAIILLIYTGLTNKKRFLRNMLLIVAAGAVMFIFITQFANDYLINKLVRLFTSTESEARVGIYEYYWDYMTGTGSIITGIGFSQSGNILKAGGFLTMNYPHNFALELVGELGVVGLILIVLVGLEIFRAEKGWFRIFQDDKPDGKQIMVFCFVNAGFLFYIMTFAKSYSIYDGYQFFIFIAMILHGGHVESDTVQRNKKQRIQ